MKIVNHTPTQILSHELRTQGGLSDLSAAILIENTRALVQKEREVTLAVLDHLAEIERRGLHLARGYGSLHEFAVAALGYSSAAAQRRIQSMRAMRDVPSIRPQIQSGELNLSQIAMIQTVARSEKISVTTKRALLEQAVAQTTRVTEVLLHEQFPENRKLTDKRFVVSAERIELRITLSRESLERLQTLKHRLAHQIRGQTDSEAIDAILKIAEKELQKRNGVIAAPTRTEVVPAEVAPVPSQSSLEACIADPKPTPHRREKMGKSMADSAHKVGALVVKPANRARSAIPRETVRRLKARAQGQCEYVDPVTLKKCTSPFALQVDHRRPVSKEGSHRFENLQILCAHHNQWKGAS